MKKSSIIRLLSLSFLALASIIILGLITLPKFILIDNLLSKNGVFLLPKSVKEGLISLELGNVTIYDRQSKIAKFDKIKITINPFNLHVEGKELQGFFDFTYSYFLKSYSVRARNLENLEKFSISEADISVDSEIRGTLKVQKIKVSGASVDALDINFKGKTFEMEAKGEGISSKGSGIIVINKNNPFESNLNGEIVDKNFKVIVSGTLKNISFDLKPLL